ncbi:dUTP diphosphatase [Paracoccus sp. TK19116]|uniref:Deoxyuridine 5'-triphosphate nucleotidohydrolase n=1 Tax=Paracoccus albicereus TaxID=2922394 RepID=A0ABT1MVP1_9RHOB|nr:dUTP diphosphatase [Paracoccus albicereus]MCQ0971556.1 dUTP diphosphatase [Paracoccus albicereus]
MQTPRIAISRVSGADPDLPLPAYASAGAAGADVRADLGGGSMTLAPGERALVPTGLRLQVPEGWEVQVRPRSGFALKQGITVLNSPGTIDSDYRGPLGVILVNLGAEPQVIAHGDRIAQLVVAPAPQATFSLVGALDDSARGERGFGSTGRE